MSNQAQVNAAAAVLKQFIKTYGATASDTMLANAIYSINAALGNGGSPAAEYADVVKEATGGEIKVAPGVRQTDNGGFEITDVNPLGIPVGVYMPEDALADIPDEKALKKMKKADLIAQAEAEQLDGEFDDGMTNDALVAAILESRKPAE